MSKEKVINLNNVERVKKFITDISEIESDVDIISGRYIIDAKSIMGIFSLNLLNNLCVEIKSDNENEIKKFNEIVEKYK